MKYLAFLALLCAGCIVDGEDGDRVSPNPPVRKDIAEQAVRDYVGGLAAAWNEAADRLEIDPDFEVGPWIETKTKDVRLKSFQKVNESMAEEATPEKLREFANQAEGVLR